ncbi:MAG: hypothetical protein JWL93_2749 [Hyphomicrobiales bacterium]|jgi:hypothetical protein|nr:hypothetical protein [Hyphomicrobiales bacterium]
MKWFRSSSPIRRPSENPRRVIKRFVRVLARLAPVDPLRGSAPFSGSVTREKA